MPRKRPRLPPTVRLCPSPRRYPRRRRTIDILVSGLQTKVRRSKRKNVQNPEQTLGYRPEHLIGT